MKLVKKWFTCAITFVAGVLGLALSATSGMKSLLGDKVVGKTKAFKVITDSDLADQAKLFKISGEFTWLKIFAIITLIVSVLLIIYAIVMLLKNLQIIKSNSSLFKTIGITLVALLLIATIGLLITSNVYANAMEDVITKLNPLMSVKLGVYQPIMLVVGIITALTTSFVWFADKKND